MTSALRALAAAVVAVAATAPTTGATVEGVVSGGKGAPQLAATAFDLATVGYGEHEFFLAGTASGYTSAHPLTRDGKWTVEPASTAPFRTRVVVYRPADAKRFNGTVLVEWNNVSGGLDAAPFWIMAHDELIRRGYAWVGVTAQRVGVENLQQKADPDRYRKLEYPGDSFSYDIFTQAGRAVRADAPTLLGGLRPKHVIAVGESQSAFRLTTYLDAVEPRTPGVYDGYLVYSRGASAAPLAQAPQPLVPTPIPTLIRTDLHVPVLVFTTETDVRLLGYASARQPDTKWLRDWEVAGTAHADTYTLGVGATDAGTRSSDAALFHDMIDPPSQAYGAISCDKPFNAGPTTYVLRAAVRALDRWVATGTPPPHAPRLERGGIRTPQTDAPIARLSGVGQSGGGFCGLFGTTSPFDAATLSARYPSRATFVKAWDTATDRAVRAGFLLPEDAAALKAVAAKNAPG